MAVRILSEGCSYYQHALLSGGLKNSDRVDEEIVESFLKKQSEVDGSALNFSDEVREKTKIEMELIQLET